MNNGVAEAYSRFTQHNNLRAFIYEIINKNSSGFIYCLAEISGQPPHIVAEEMSVLIRNYLNDVYNVLSYFHEEEMECFVDYLHHNPNAARTAFDYLLTTLSNKLKKEEMRLLFYSMLEPYQTRRIIHGYLE